MQRNCRSVRLSDSSGIDIPDLPLEMGILNIVHSNSPGECNVYGPTYRDTYSYNGSNIQWMIQYNIGFNIDPPDYIIHHNPIGIIHLNQILLACNMIHVDSCNRDSIYRSKVDWGESTAWADGGSWGRVYINIRNRQSNGMICPTGFHEVRDDIVARILRVLPGCSIYKPDELWNCSGIPPDLLVRYPGYEFDDMVNCDMMEDYSDVEV